MFWIRAAGVVVVAVVGVIATARMLPRAPDPLPLTEAHPCLTDPTFQATVNAVDAEFRQAWAAAGLQPAPAASADVLRRRISLGLAGTLPSFEEHQRGAAQATPHAWLDHVLRDRRSSDYLAERFARAFVGTENGPFILFRRRRFVSWLSDSLAANQPYDKLVRQLITENGLRTDRPAVNFVTVTLDQNNENQPDEIRLAARTVRAFLGVRLDCVQCHDDNLGGPWKQTDFHELAAFYAECRLGMTGVYNAPRDYSYQYLHAEAPTVVPPRVPFLPEAVPAEGSRREQLASWVTAPANKNFARVIVNRCWAFLCGRPLVEPIDSVPLEGPYPPGLELLADDLREHGYDLQRLMHLIVATQAFQRDSQVEKPNGEALTEQHEKLWASFPVTRLRPEQVVGATLQACSLSTQDYDSHILLQLIRFGQEQDFIKRYGDAGEDEFDVRAGTIPQRLLMLNGNLVRERTGDNIVLNASTRIAALAKSDSQSIEVAYRCVLGRAPTPAETAHFCEKWRGSAEPDRKNALEDLYWVLLNSSEFSWNH